MKDQLLQGVYLNSDTTLLQEALRGTIEGLATLQQHRSPWVKEVVGRTFDRLADVLKSDPEARIQGWIPGVVRE